MKITPSRRAIGASISCAMLVGVAAFAVGGPSAPGPPQGDFNADGFFDLSDLDALVNEIASGTNDAMFDLDGDGLVNLADRDIWLAIAGPANGVGGPYQIGDANLDGVVDGSDFVTWNSERFTSTGLWSLGDFNADGVTDVSDFNLWNERKFTSAGP